jgi:hypothetical protein
MNKLESNICKFNESQRNAYKNYRLIKDNLTKI